MQSHDFPPSAFFSPFLFYTTFTNYPTITRFRTGGERTRSKVYYLHAEQTLPTAASGAARGEQPDYFWQPYDEFWRKNVLSERHAQYYAARAEGGAGIIVLEEHIVHPSDWPYQYALQGYLPETVQAIAAVTERIHAHGTLALAQLNHNGQQSVSDHRQAELW